MSDLTRSGGDNFWYGSLTLQVKYDVSVNLTTQETFLTPVLDSGPEEDEEEEEVGIEITEP